MAADAEVIPGHVRGKGMFVRLGITKGGGKSSNFGFDIEA